MRPFIVCLLLLAVFCQAPAFARRTDFHNPLAEIMIPGATLEKVSDYLIEHQSAAGFMLVQQQRNMLVFEAPTREMRFGESMYSYFIGGGVRRYGKNTVLERKIFNFFENKNLVRVNMHFLKVYNPGMGSEYTEDLTNKPTNTGRMAIIPFLSTMQLALQSESTPVQSATEPPPTPLVEAVKPDALQSLIQTLEEQK